MVESERALEQEIAAPTLVRLLRDWQGWRRGRELPSRADFTPLTLRYLLGDIVLLDVESAPLRFRYRLIGTNLVRRRGLDLTGRYLDEHPDASFLQEARDAVTKVVHERRPLHHHYNLLGSTDTWIDYQMLVLPLATDGKRIDMLLIGHHFPE